VRWLARPPVHFVAIGFALFALERHAATPLPITPRPMVVITAERLAQARPARAPVRVAPR